MRPPSRGYGRLHVAAADGVQRGKVGRHAPSGDSGDFIGQEEELRVRYRIDPRLEVEAGYAHFSPGPFVENTGPADDADLFYVQTTFHF